MWNERAGAAQSAQFRELYRRHYGFVWHVARRFGVADHALDDVVQDAFVTAYRRMGSLADGSAKAWLYGITRRVASNHRRSQRRTVRRLEALAHAPAADASTTPRTTEALHTLERFLSTLPADQREIFVLAAVEGMNGAEVARVLDLRPSTTYDQLRALRASFREHIAGTPPGPLVRRARRERPRATAGSWLALVGELPALGQPALGASWLASLASIATAKPLAVGLGMAGVAVAGLLVARTTVSAPRVATEPVSQVEPRPATASHGPTPAYGSPTPAHESPTAVSSSPPTAAVATPVVASASRAEPEAPRARPRLAVAAPEPEPGLAAENALLREATRLLAEGRASDALDLTNRHAEQFGASSLADVRTALRIESLCALGKHAQARGEAQLFLRARASSPVADRIARACRSAP